MLLPPQELIHQDRGHQHGYRDRKAVSRGHRLHRPEIQHDEKTAETQDPVDTGDIDLPADIRRKFNGHFGPEIETDGFIYQRKGTTDQRLAGDDGGGSGDKYAGDEEPMGNDHEKGVDATQAVLVLQQHPCPLPEIVQHQTGLHKDPAHLDILAPAMSQIAVQGLGAGSTKEYGTQQPETLGMTDQ